MTRNFDNFLNFNSYFYRIEIYALKFVIVVIFYKKNWNFLLKSWNSREICRKNMKFIQIY